MPARPRRRLAVLALLLAYGAGLAAIALWPRPVDRPFAVQISHFLRDLRDASLLPDWFTYQQFEFTMNVCLFAAGSVLALLLVGYRRWPAVLVGGLAVSVVIELWQAWGLPDRVPSLGDVVANAVGTLVGVVLVVVSLRWAAKEPEGRAAGRL